MSDDFHERVQLAKEIDQAKLDLALNAKGKMIYLTEAQWQGLSESTFEFLRRHNEKVIDENRKCEIQHTIRSAVRR